MKHIGEEEQIASLRVRWTLLGSVVVDSSEKLAFPKAGTEPGLYKLCIAQSGTVRRIYIGESDNLSRRFSNYRNPGPTQQTSLRINRILVDHLKAGDEITVLISRDCGASPAIGEVEPNLSSKLVRRMFEHFAAATHDDAGIELLNL